ncbi:type II secretion system F family protein [Alkaliphilus peptidifermentans]|uniref:Tight adherence protein C n=1 Tax=Alkaliphilus peptidifermentans DSM 18978 TaxID=1120976 RepID=A0A1G5J9I8_9FIRM|nr:type II secretion system F family protein [Alkaliphilus peptidifermentans]SCY84489.1 tight adherence protein C [Alkaliphilus peptidifermentans DSM 18978]
MIFFFLFIHVCTFFMLYILSRNKYEEFTALTNSTEYPLRKLLPVGLLILDCVNYKFRGSYDKRLFNNFIELYGVKKGRSFQRIHWANIITIMLIEGIVICFYGMVLGIETITLTHLLLYFAILFLTAYGLGNEIKIKIRRRHILLKLDFTEFVNKIALLIDAGLTVSAALERIATDSNIERPLYKEINETLMEIQGGKAEMEAFENFAHRCRVPEVFKFVAILLQTIKKGNSQMASMLRLLSNECWIMRRNTAKTLGEEASTKLLFPMMMILCAILIIVLTPAVLALYSM